jgi:hypothetical protein
MPLIPAKAGIQDKSPQPSGKHPRWIFTKAGEVFVVFLAEWLSVRLIGCFKVGNTNLTNHPNGLGQLLEFLL